MKLNDVLALRPAKGIDAAGLSAAIGSAEAIRRRLRAEEAEANTARAGMLLAADDKAIAAAEGTAAAAQLGAERIEAILPLMRGDLAAVQGRETVAALQAEHAALLRKLAELRRWQAEDYPQIAVLIGRGHHAHDAAAAAHADFVCGVKAAYQRPEVRDAGLLDVVELPQLDGVLPRQVFSNWNWK